MKKYEGFLKHYKGVILFDEELLFAIYLFVEYNLRTGISIIL